MQIEELLKKILERLDESNELLRKIYNLNFDAKLIIESNNEQTQKFFGELVNEDNWNYNESKIWYW